METYQDQILDSPSKNSYIGSYYQPPDTILGSPRQLNSSAHSSISTDAPVASLRPSETRPNIDSTAVVDALKTLQEKIRRLELERKQAEKSYQTFCHDAQKPRPITAANPAGSQPVARTSATDNTSRKELDLKLQSAEARCQVLEKQLEYMRRMVENAKKERDTFIEKQAALQRQQPSSSCTQREKLEKLESEYLKLSKTQTMAEMKLSILEQKLLKEEHERKLVQEKADELQRELDVSLRLSLPNTEATKPKKKTKHALKNTSEKPGVTSPPGQRHNNLPFVAGTSTSPSHSVHANVQSILHMMKHHQPQLCERVGALHSAKRSLQRNFSAPSTAPKKHVSLPEQADRSLSSLSDLLLALQDELGQMSFEQQELEHQIDETHYGEQKQELQRELERLIKKMEEKAAQITKLRKHQQMVKELTKGQPCADGYTAKSAIQPPAPFCVKAKQKGKKSGSPHKNLQLLRESQKLRKSLKQDDLSWET